MTILLFDESVDKLLSTRNNVTSLQKLPGSELNFSGSKPVASKLDTIMSISSFPNTDCPGSLHFSISSELGGLSLCRGCSEFSMGQTSVFFSSQRRTKSEAAEFYSVVG